MTVKIFGSVCLILSALYYSYLLIKGANERLAALDGLCAFILFIQKNIESFARPVGEIVQAYSGYGSLLEPFMEVSRSRGIAYAAKTVKLPIGENARQLFIEFAETIGNGYKEDALRLCSYCYDELHTILEKEREETRKKLKMYRTLPVMSAMSVVLILL